MGAEENRWASKVRLIRLFELENTMPWLVGGVFQCLARKKEHNLCKDRRKNSCY